MLSSFFVDHFLFFSPMNPKCFITPTVNQPINHIFEAQVCCSTCLA